MKTLNVTLASLLLAACVMFSQTRIPPGQVQVQPTTGVYVNVTGGGGSKGMVLATVDPATMVLDTSGAVPILRALPQAPVINEKHVVLKPAVGATTLIIPDASYVPASLSVIVNGIEQALTDDYTVTGTTVTLIRPSATGDIDQLQYRF